MSANNTVRKNGFAEMAYVGEVPWHGLGQSVTKGASIGVWQKESGLDWEAIAADVRFSIGGGLFGSYPGNKVLYRSDSFEPVGLVSDKFKIVQPMEVLEFFRDLTESGDWHIHTAGSLKGGSKLWAMASSNLEGRVGKNDKVLGNLLLATALDGSMKTTAKLVSTRVVCANTLAIALSEGGDEVKVSHRSEFDPADVKDSLGVSVDAFKLFMSRANELAETPIKLDEATELLRSLFGQPTEKEIKPTRADFEFQRLMAQFGAKTDTKLREQRSVQRALALFSGEGMGSQLPGSVGSRWGLLNAITQHVDHEMGRTVDNRTDSAWFGRGSIIKGAAFELLAEV